MEKKSLDKKELEMVVSQLSERETREILQVIHRDELLRERDQYRVM